ncbi:amino acid adenylation domain-containing protein [Sorangium sp. So ce131]|uniref:amino acid adenylation domain-containing protein n=1 Tax=Sorangium sp. So ce131 TaxID=3133282 RepID=UPI003F648545
MSRSDVTFRPEDVGTLVDVLKQRAARQPDRTAYIFLSDKGRREDRLTYAELDREARKMAAFLLGLGAPGDRVVLLYPPGLEYIVAFMGCLYAGMIAVPLYPPRRNQKIFRVQEIFKNASPIAAVTCASLYETVSEFMSSSAGAAGLRVYSTTGLPGQGDAELPEVKAHDLAFLQYTSGSTGAPKGVMVGHGNLMANERAIRGAFRTSEEDVFVNWLPLFHDMGLIANVLQPLYVGFPSVLMSPLDFVQNPMRWLEAITKYGGTVGGAPNFAYNLCVEKISPEKLATLDLRSWRIAYNGAEPIRAETLERFATKFAAAGFAPQAFYCCYGMAEATLMVTGGDLSAVPVVRTFDKAALAARSARPPERDGSAAALVGCGSAPEGHRVCIVEPASRRALPDGEVGEIWIAGPSVAGGYWERPDLSRETFEATTEGGEGPFLRSGDLGFFHGGELYVAGRMKDTIILRGRNLYPQDIEAVVSTSHPALKPYSAAAFGVEVDGEERVVVVQEVARGSKSTAWSEVFPAIHQAVAESHDLALHAVVLIPPGALPLTSSGKVQRHAARARFLEGSLDVVARSGALGAEHPEERAERPEARAEGTEERAERPEERAGTPPEGEPPPEGGSARHDVGHLQEVVLRLVAAALKVNPGDLDVSRPLAQYGLSSKAAVALTGDLENELKVSVSPTLVYDHPTIAQLAHALAGGGAPEPARTTQRAPVRPDGRQEPVAIVGIGCRFPGASGPEAFWELLQKGGDAIRALPPERRALLGLREDGEPLWGGYLDGIELFDPEHFGISPREADAIDPQQRLVLEVAQEALHFAGIAPSRLAGSLTGVFMGVSTHDYERLAAGSTAGAFAAAGSAASVVANRLSYTLDLRGPSVVVDTACSSSLVAVHYACRSLESGECDVAIAGGVNVLLDPGVTRAMIDGHFMAPDGRCKTFDASADGYVRSEGCGVVVLKRLRDAQRDGDPVLAVIRGSALHQDGRSNGLHAPNGPAQEAVIRAALDRAGVAPAQIQYVEAHGTGTALGDPIEFGAIRNALGRDRGPEARCGVGSVKTNLGHMEAAAGIGGLLKVVNALGHRELPGNLFLRQLNPHISLEGGFFIPTRAVPWETGEPTGAPRLAGVSSFGFGGTIAHVILEQAPADAAPREVDLPDARRAARRPVHLLPLSARSDAALRELAGRCKDHLARHPEVDVADFCHTLAVGRDVHELRLAVSARDAGELCRHLEGYLDGAVTPAVKVGRARRRPRVAFLFSGHGAQYAGMGRALYETLPPVRATLDRCDAFVRERLGCSLISVLYPEGEPDGRLHQPQLAQVALFSLQVALAELLMSWGISPDAVMGHSLGEFAAACAAGVFDLEDGLRLVLERGRLLQSVSAGGGMVTVYASEAEVEQHLTSTPAVSVAAVNSPQNTLVSGPVDALERLMTRLDSAGVRNRRTNVNLAFHSAMVEPILDEFERIAASVHHRAPRVLFGSTLTGRPLEGAPSARYWRAQLRQKVRFTEGLASLRAAGCEVFVEIGPRQVLTGLADEALGGGVSCFPMLKADVPEWDTLTEMLAGLHVAGVRVDFERAGRSEGLRRVPGLPSPALERRRCWFDDAAPRSAGDVGAARATARLPGVEVARSAAALSPAPAAAPEGRAADVLEQLTIVVARLLKTSPERLDPDRPLLEIGADSLMLMDAIRAVRDHFGVVITVRQVFKELPTLSAIASYVDGCMPPPAPAAHAAPAPSHGAGVNGAGANGAGVNGAGVNGAGVNGAGVHPAPIALVQPAGEGTAAVVARLMDQHTQVITMALQLLGAPQAAQPAAPVQMAAPQALAALASPAALAAASPAVSRSPVPPLAPRAAGAAAEARPAQDQKRSYTAFGPYNPAKATAHTKLGEGDTQERHLRALSARYTAKTGKSKALTQQYRAVLADNRASAGFRFSTKEMVYPIAAERLEGPYVWDLDGNRYVDVAMGFGVSLLGHNPPIVSQAITRQLQAGGIELGPRSRYAGEVAALVCELTGVERAAFCTSGTEAVMTALRIARTATGRRKIAMFGVSYHGHFDTVLARPSGRPGEPSLPIAPGVPDELVKDTIVLEYGDFSELERLRAIGGELAAVLVEPVQSRRPGLQPGRFLKELRAVTQELGIVLIFDEMVTGFRVHPGGAQAYFGVRADLATYGKVLGGGLPIGCVAGKAEFMDAIDGGYWEYGDGSYPGAETTFLAGTYQMHSLSMVSARAVLTHLKEQGPALQERLGARTAAFADRVREVFRETGAPIGLSSFSSYFRFHFEGNLDLFFYHLIDKGVFVWEGRTCFLSTAHGDEDVDHIVSAVEQTVHALQKDGFLPPPPRPGGPGSRTGSGSNGASTPRENGVAAAAPALDPARAQAAVVEATLPLSEAQKQLWFLSKLNPGALAAYVETTALEMHGPLDVDRLRRAVALLAERHDALRIHVAEDGSHQVVSPRAEVALEVVGCAAASEAEAEGKAARWLDARRVHLELHRGPLVGFTLLSLNDHRHVLVVDGHHIVIDGLSLAVMLEDLAELYNALCEGRAPALAPAPPHGAFAAHEQTYLASARAGVDEDFFRTRFPGGIEPTELPTSRPRPEVFTFAGARHEIALDPEVWRRLKEAGRHQGCTPFMLLLAGYVLLIARLAGREDIVVGFPVAGRSFEGGERFVGYCTHLAPFRARVPGGARFEELLAAVKRDVLDVYEHQDLPFAHLIRRLDHRVALDRGAAVSLAFNLNRVDAAAPFWRMRTAAAPTPIHHAKFDLLLDVLETGDGARLQFDYATSLFDEETIARFARAYVRLLTAGAERPARRLRELPLLSDDELRDVLWGFNRSERPYPQHRCLHELFEAQAARTPERVALVFEAERLTYAELNRRANQLAHHLRRHGVGPDTVVAVVAERSVELVVALYGVLKAGGAYLPIDPTYPSERIRVLLEDAASPVVLTQEKWRSGLPETSAHVVCVDADWSEIAPESGDDLRPVSGPDHLAYVIYTSGSTGRPKGVENSHRGIVNRLLWMLEDSGLGEQDAVLQKTPYTFDVSVWELFAPLLCGAQLVVAAPEGHRDPGYLADVIEAHAITTVHFVPSMLQAFLEPLDARQCRSLRRVICSGEALSRELEERFFRKLGDGEGAPELQNLYGPTEAAVDVTSWRCRRGDSHGSVPIGKPVANTRIYLLDGGLQPVPVGMPGELYIGGVQVARGYLKRPALTAERFIPDPFSGTPGARLYRTGDLARFLPDGTVLFLGRIDHQVKLRGFRIELGEIEAALLASAEVREATVLLREDRPGDPRLVAYVVPRSGVEVDAEALRRSLERSLPSYMVPGDLVALPAMPLTTSGKLDRKALPAPALEPAAGGEHVAPSGEAEIKLAEIWQEVLGRSRVSAADEFFASGGHSLLATQLVSRVRTAFGVDLPLRAVFEAPVLAQLAARIERARRGALDGAPAIPLVPRGDAPPAMSFAQERLWFLQQLDPESPAYNMAAAVRLSGDLDREALHGCLCEVVRRHEALRATFATDADGSGVQRIAPAVALPLPVFDLSGMPEAEREGALARVAREEAERPFDLAEGPLVRSALVRLGATEHVWLLGMHHIVSDDWSIGVFVREVSALYAAFAAGRPSPLPPLPIQYADHARWQRQALSGEALERELAYWTRQLPGIPGALELPADRPRPAAQSFRGGEVPVVLPAELAQALRALSLRENATLFMTLLAAFQALLGRYSRQSDVVVGSPVAGRTRAEVEGLIGLFVNTLALRADLRGDPPFVELLRQVRDTALGAYAHQALPFERIVDALGVPRDLSRTPVFQVLFTLQNAPVQVMQLAGLSLREEELPTRTAKFDLDLTLREVDGALVGTLEYSADLFDASTAERMAGHLCTLLEGVAAAPATRISRLPLLTAAERRQILVERNRTARDFTAVRPEWRPAARFTELFEAQAERTPDAVAVACDGERWTYAELDDRARRVGRALRERGVGRGDVVGLLLDRGVELVAAILGVFKAGGAYMPLDADWPDQRLATALAQSKARAIVCAAPSQGRAGALGAAPALCIAELLRSSPAPRGASPAEGSADDLAYVLFTSGSTGAPKGVMVTHAGMLNQQFAKVVELGLGAGDTMAQTARQTFDISVWQLLNLLLVGGRVLILKDEQAWAPRPLLTALSAQRATIFETVPTHLRLLLDELEARPEAYDLSALRWLMPTGEALLPELCERWFRALPRVPMVNAYGPTECSDDTSLYKLHHAPPRAWKYVPIHGCVANLRNYVLDERLEPVPDGVPGELCIGGVGVGRGYIADPGRTAQAFVPDPFAGTPGARMYRTGDLVRFLADGSIEFLGRIDHQVKIRGFRIELGEIEAALSLHPGVRECVVLMREDGQEERRLVAYVVPAGDAEGGALARHLQERLPAYMVPSAFVLLDAFPLLSNGKIDRRALPAPAAGAADAAEQHAAARTPTEVILAGIFRDLLRVDPVGRFANFFSLGGHSLLATRLVSRVREAFGVELALRAVFERQTLAELAVAVEEARELDRAEAAGPIEPAPRDGIEPLPLSFAQQRLWFLHQLEEPSDAYNMAGAYRLRGALHVEALGRAYSDLLARHETLRTRFPAEGGEPRQVIEPPAAGRVAVIDLSDRDEAEREAALRRLVDEEGASRFDLATGPLVRCRLLRLGPADHALQVTLHHIISDGWSVRVFLDELIALYNHHRLGGEGAYPLPSLPVQYVDFACWQRAHLRGERLARQLDFWKTQLAGAPLLLSLPTDRPRPALQSMKGAVARFTLDSDLTAELRALGRRFDVTFFMTLFAAFNVLLSRYSGQTDLLVGVPVANRTRKEIEALIGFFVNTLVLRSDLSGNPTFEALLRRVRQTTLDAYAHQDLPFEQVVEAVRPERNLSHHPLFQVMFDVQDADDEVMRLEGLEIEPLEPERVTSMFDMSVTLEELGGGLRGTVEYNTDLFAGSTVRRMIEHFTTLLRLLAAAPHRRVGELEMLGAGELAALTASWEVAPPPALAGDPRRGACVHQLIAQRAAEDPGATALSSGDRRVSYGEMTARAGALARRLRALGVGPEVLVGLCAEDGIALVTGVVAVLMAGGAYLCLDPGHPRDRLAELLSDARPSVLLCSERDAAALLEHRAHRPHGAAVVTLDPFLEGPAPAGEAAPEPTPCSPDNAAYVVYTSGTTGKPKGVTVTHRALVNDYLAWEHEFLLAGGPACHLQMASSAFDVFSGEVLRALCSGGRLVFCPRGLLVEPDKLYALMRRERVDCADFIPAVLRALADHLEQTGQDLGFMKLVVVGSDVWTAEDHARFRALCGPSTRLINAYGVSEATIDSTWFEAPRLERDGERSVPIGRPMPGVRALVLDAHLMPVPAGVPGELFLGGVGVARGYLNRPGHTAERFLPDPFAHTPGERLYRTGDLARLLPDGNLALLGRADHQVKIRGFRVEPDEIAAVVAAHPGVREAVVVVREERPGDKRLAAYLTLGDGGDGAPPPRAEDVKRFLRDKLPHYMVPSAIEVLDAMPLTQNRKIDRAALSRRRLEGAGPIGADAPRTPAEELLAGVFRDVLGVQTVRRSDSFFDLGGHSLLATQLASRAAKVFGRELPLRVIFEEPVLAALADYLQRAELHRQAPPLQRVSRDRPLPLSFSQEQLWTAAQLAPDGGAYNMSAGLRVRGALDVDVVRAALAEIARRHEILRMRVEIVDGRPAMVAGDDFPLAAAVEDLEGIHGREAREAELARRFEAEAAAPFDLSRAPLVRLKIFRLAPEEVVLAFTLHHMLCDGWSLSVLVRELVACYEALAAGRPHRLPELPFQYADLATWQRRWMSGEVLEGHIEHFARKLGGELPVLALPLDRPRSRRRSDAGARLVQPLDGELARALAELGRGAGATLNMTLMAGFLALLYRFSRQDDLLLGMTVAGRGQVEAEPLIGCFINNVVLRFDLSARPSYRDLLAQVRRETLEAYDHQALPFEKLIEALNPPREPGVTPFFQVVFSAQNTPSEELSIPGLEIEELPAARETARYDLTVWVNEAPGALSVEWTYSTDLFEAATIREMVRGYEEVLRRVVSDPEIGLLGLSSSRDGDAARGQGASKQAALKEKLLGARRQAKRIDLSE